MAISEILFYLCAFCTLLFGSLVVTSRNPVNSAMFLVLTIVSLAGLFVKLHAFFLAAVQIVVYAGAVMVLFLFVIMLLDLKEEERRRIKLFGLVGGTVAIGAIAAISLKEVFGSAVSKGLPAPMIEGGPKELGMLLFKNYLLPFEILSVLLLVAMVGAILLSKKDLK